MKQTHCALCREIVYQGRPLGKWKQQLDLCETMIKLRYSKRLFKRISSSSKAASARGGGDGHGNAVVGGGEIEWEVRPGGMLVQKRNVGGGEEMIMVRVSTTGFSCHDVSIGATCTFGELKAMLSMVTGLEPREQRLLFRGKEREDTDHLHMVGVGDKDKVLLLEDPALKDLKTRATAQVVRSACQSLFRCRSGQTYHFAKLM